MALFDTKTFFYNAGRGVQALQAGFDTQVKAAQAQFARLFTEMVSLCFEVDEKVFGNMTKHLL